MFLRGVQARSPPWASGLQMSTETTKLPTSVVQLPRARCRHGPMRATGGANRPPRFLRWANARLTQGLERGRAPAFMRLLTVRGRVTGEPHATPVVPVIRDGDVWVVSPYGEVAWVRNVRRAGQLELRRSEERTSYEARELNAREATPVLRAYLTMPTHWVVRRHFKVTKRSSDDAIGAEADRHPIFALTPVS
jgi:deazaflavin-dependent oxidoreductase (nitroreductase family)